MATTSDAAVMLQSKGPRLFDSGKQILDDLELEAADSAFRGLALAAPAEIDTALSKTLPVVLLTQQTVLRAWEVPEAYNLMLAVSELDTGKVYVSPALVDRKRDERPARGSAPPRPNDAAARGIATKARHLDLQIEAHHSGMLAVAAFSFDWVSNTSTVDVVAKDPRPVTGRAEISPAPSPTQDTLPSYAPTSSGPRTPQNGLAFVIDKTRGQEISVHGAFSKILSTAEDLYAPLTVKDNAVDRQATAVVPVTIVVIGLNSKMPRLYALGVPVYDASANPVLPASARFAVNISEADAPLPQGRYVAYIFMSGAVYGPQRFDVQ